MRIDEADTFRSRPLADAAQALAPNLQSKSEALQHELQKTRADVFARCVQRLNQACSAPFALLLGAVLAVRMRGALPLQIYMLAFIPAIACMLFISGGEQLVRSGSLAFGALVASTGNLILFSLITYNWRLLAQH